jgi:hypothetical protein
MALALGARSELNGRTAPVEDGVLVDIRVWTGRLNITLVVECADGRYYGTLRTAKP